MSERFYDKSRIHAENAEQLRRSGYALVDQKKYADSMKEFKAALQELDLEQAELEKIPASDTKHYADEVRLNTRNRVIILSEIGHIYYNRAVLEKGNNRIIALNEALAKYIAARDLLAALPEPREWEEQKDLNSSNESIVNLLSSLKRTHTENTERLRNQGRALLQEKKYDESMQQFEEAWHALEEEGATFPASDDVLYKENLEHNLRQKAVILEEMGIHHYVRTSVVDEENVLPAFNEALEKFTAAKEMITRHFHEPRKKHDQDIVDRYQQKIDIVRREKEAFSLNVTGVKHYIEARKVFGDNRLLQFQKALKHFVAASEMDPNDETGKKNILNTLREIELVRTEKISAMLALGISLREQKKLHEAKEIYKELLKECAAERLELKAIALSDQTMYQQKLEKTLVDVAEFLGHLGIVHYLQAMEEKGERQMAEFKKSHEIFLAAIKKTCCSFALRRNRGIKKSYRRPSTECLKSIRSFVFSECKSIRSRVL